MQRLFDVYIPNIVRSSEGRQFKGKLDSELHNW